MSEPESRPRTAPLSARPAACASSSAPAASPSRRSMAPTRRTRLGRAAAGRWKGPGHRRASSRWWDRTGRWATSRRRHRLHRRRSRHRNCSCRRRGFRLAGSVANGAYERRRLVGVKRAHRAAPSLPLPQPAAKLAAATAGPAALTTTRFEGGRPPCPPTLRTLQRWNSSLLCWCCAATAALRRGAYGGPHGATGARKMRCVQHWLCPRRDPRRRCRL